MKQSIFSSFLATAAFVQLAVAHTRVYSLWVDGTDQGVGAGVYIRQPPSNSPVKDLTSTDVRCNVDGTTAVSGTVEVAAGATVEPEWFHDNRGDDIIDGSHKGPIVAYLAPADSNGEGAVWTKIAEDGYDGSEWAVTRLIANKGKHSVTIPSSLAAGDYILRVEILALHESDTLYSENSARGIQLYPSCSQITVTGSGTTTLPAGAEFPGEYKDSDAGIHFNLYNDDANSYVIPGPAVWDGATGGSASSTAAGSSTAVATSSAAASSIVAIPTSADATSAVETSAAATSVVASEPAASEPAATASSSKPATPASTSKAAATSAVATSATGTKATSAAAAPTTSSAACTKDAYNCCWDAYNACAAEANRSQAGKGNVDFSACSNTRTTCLSGVSRRHARMWSA